MINKRQIVLLGMIFLQKSSIIAMQNENKTPKSPQILESSQKKNPLSCSAELRKSTAAIQITIEKNKNTSFMYYKYPGNSSPVEWAPYHEYRDEPINPCDCP